MTWAERLATFAKRKWLWSAGVAHLYSDLIATIQLAKTEIQKHGVSNGDVVFLRGDFNELSVAAFFALEQLKCIIVPHTGREDESRIYQRIVPVDFEIDANGSSLQFSRRLENARSDKGSILLDQIRVGNTAGLILFSSGSGGEPKAVVHDLTRFSARFENTKVSEKKIAAFLLFDHIGGLNTLLMTLAMGAELVALPSRSVDSVFSTLRAARVQVLPCSPTFLRLAVTAFSSAEANLPDLETITYGTEPMPEAVLAKLSRIFPKIKFKQTYGLSETGIFPTRSPESNSTWFELGDAKNQVRIVDGLLEIRTPTSMLGYLNAPNPFTADGWYKTGDRIEQKPGEPGLFRILGRASETINVGGLKVHPAEVEEFLSKIDDIEEVVVAKEKHPLLGEIVVAHVRPRASKTLLEMTRIIQDFSRGKIEAYKIPQKIILHADPLHTSRFKKKNLSS